MGNFFQSGQGYRFYTKATLICVMMVILVGSLVKVTDSGMGCPDWPKCYGHLIPPFNAEDVAFQKNQSYFKGQMIIHDNKLWSAEQNFTSNNEFFVNNWTHFNKHNYTNYNPFHTMVEYINRLATVVLGIVALLMFYYSFSFFKKNTIHLLFSCLVLVLIGFEAWLGRLVVDSKLSPLKVSVHLYAAFLLVIIMVTGLSLSNKVKPNAFDFPKKALLISWLVLLVQLFLGTQLREVFDDFYAHLHLAREHWIEQSGMKFIVHRSFSIVYLLLILYLSFVLNKNPSAKKLGYTFLLPIICLIEISSGVIMAYFEVPKYMQPFHVFMSASLLLAHSYLLVEAFKSKIFRKAY